MIALLFLGEAQISTFQGDLALETFLRFFSIQPSQIEFAPHEWAEIPEPDKERTLAFLRKERYEQLKARFEEHVRMAAGPLNDPVNALKLGAAQKRYPNARLLPESPPPLDDFPLAEAKSKPPRRKNAGAARQTPRSPIPAVAPPLVEASASPPGGGSDRNGTLWIVAPLAGVATVALSTAALRPRRSRRKPAE
ncbi:MAG: hypothetical protein NTW86_30630 [Candidatus Sumerlaeota bacterium]|nr:hypothetical protein [Candidatus Sumerlaeota bacterium]